MKQKIETFDSAWKELQEIHVLLQNNLDIGVTELSKYHKRATELLEYCKNELRNLQNTFEKNSNK